MTKKSQKPKKEKTSKRVKFNLGKTQSPIKRSTQKSEQIPSETSNIKSILKVKSSKEQIKHATCSCQTNITTEESDFSKKCELALEKFFTDNIDLFLTLFRKYHNKQIEVEANEEEEIEEEDHY